MKLRGHESVQMKLEIHKLGLHLEHISYIGWVVKYFHQYQTRATGNWAPSLHGYEYGNISVRNGYAENGYTHLGTTSRSTWFTLEHKFSQNYRFW